ncbi:MAG TPA: FAD-dependent oxidoreductase [Streptosporangiaceae bacterium]|nr:FAD-dependent oxidoreductase [Streptosporangiaceae bacterium]
MKKPTFVIAGASLTGAKAAEELRAQGFDGRVLLAGAEPERPYERPPLTKGYLRGEAERAQAYVHAEDFYVRQEIELVTGVTVTAVDAGASRVTLDDGSTAGYDRLLLATGAEPRRIEVPGAGLDGVYYLRTLADCELLRERLAAGGRVAVVGAGWIGSEFAASARQRGLEVAVIDPQPLPNARIFGPEIGTFYRDLHARHGVDLALGDAVDSFEGDGAITRVRTTSGRQIECDFAVVGIGVVPRTALADEAGLQTGNGIAVDDKLRTSAPGIFAAGDVANAWHPSYQRQIRVEHWANALHQGPAAARAMLGQPVSYDRIPYFFSDQYEMGMEYSGYAPHWDEVVFRGVPASGEFIAFWLHQRRVVAGMNVNVWDVHDYIRGLIGSGQPVTAAALADPGTPLDSLAAALAARD